MNWSVVLLVLFIFILIASGLMLLKPLIGPQMLLLLIRGKVKIFSFLGWLKDQILNRTNQNNVHVENNPN